ncbi:BamA/TamA family outer membrane protein [candidate division KSB1 bacterium]|nr:BamA/TamA family outer membrane protein [candidate division KSB1 bacterium]
MLSPPRLFPCVLLALLGAVSLVFAGLNPDDYDRWQAFNGWRIRVIEFPGIHSFSRAELLDVMATEKPTWLRRYVRLGGRTIFFADDFAADVVRVERFYAREGFLHIEVAGRVFPDPEREELRLQVEIREGEPTIVSNWNIVMGSDSGAGVDSARWSALMPIGIGKRFSTSAIKTSADTLAYKLRTIGHARARVETRTAVDSVANTGHVTFTLFPGHFCYLGRTTVTGLRQVREATARRELAYAPYSPYSPAKLELTRRNLVRLETFRYVTVRPDLSAPGDTLPVIVATEEGNRYRLRYGAGYHSVQRARGDVEFTDLNFFGHGRRMTLSGVYAEFQREAKLKLFYPHVPWNRTDLTIVPAWTRESSPLAIVEDRTATTIFSMNLSEKARVSVSNEAGRTLTDQKDESGTDLGTIHFTKSIETVSLGWDTRDHPLVPRKGHFVGITLSESGAAYRVFYRYWKSVIQTKVLIPQGRFTVLAGKADAGVMGPLHDSAETPSFERFTLGGPSTVRGWRMDGLSPRAAGNVKTILGGNLMLSLTAELRRNVWGPVSLAGFVDAGNVWSEPDGVQPSNLYPSAGIGLLFVTLVGPLRVDYGYQLRPNPFGDRPYAIHFSFGAPF